MITANTDAVNDPPAQNRRDRMAELMYQRGEQPEPPPGRSRDAERRGRHEHGEHKRSGHVNGVSGSQEGGEEVDGYQCDSLLDPSTSSGSGLVTGRQKLRLMSNSRSMRFSVGGWLDSKRDQNPRFSGLRK